MDEFLIIMGLVVFYNLFKIIFNIIRVIFLKKKVKKFLKIDLISEIIYFLGWINLMRNEIILVPSQIFHSVFYYVAILIFLINKRDKKIHNYILFSIITIDIIIVLFLLNMLKLYLITVITIIVYIFIIVILRKDRDKLRDCGYLTLSLLDIANIFISYIAFIGYVVSAFWKIIDRIINKKILQIKITVIKINCDFLLLILVSWVCKMYEI